MAKNSTKSVFTLVVEIENNEYSSPDSTADYLLEEASCQGKVTKATLSVPASAAKTVDLLKD